MDAKSRANFINSVAKGQTVPCPQCNAANEPDANFCIVCGAKLTKAGTDTPAFGAASEAPKPASVPEKMTEEEKAVFADGLPSWDILPPQVVVRRR